MDKKNWVKSRNAEIQSYIDLARKEAAKQELETLSYFIGGKFYDADNLHNKGTLSHTEYSWLIQGFKETKEFIAKRLAELERKGK